MNPPSPRDFSPASCFGFHYDFHAQGTDDMLGSRCESLVEMLARAHPDFVQTDCKGHPGYTSWLSQTPEASVPPKLKHDALVQWREATRKLGLPLHCHYSGIWDMAAAAKHPNWAVVRASTAPSGEQAGQNTGTAASEKMCPRSPYLHELMIPQFKELINRYSVDGFWIDGDIWGIEPCYCERCLNAFKERAGLDTPPTETDDPQWPAWWRFTFDSFMDYVRAYCDAVHGFSPHARVCSNWLHTFSNPGEPVAPVDWISGDNAHVWGLDSSRCEARFISTRGKPWDIMLWGFFMARWQEPSAPYCFKPFDMLAQEAAMIVAMGGRVQCYENPRNMRDGRLIGWHQDRLGALADFVRERWPLCRDSEIWPHAAVLHSEHHLFGNARSRTLFYNLDLAPVRAAIYAGLENHLCIDVLDEWALLPRLDAFPLVIVPEREGLSTQMVTALAAYVERGGNLLITGAECCERFAPGFIGAVENGRFENAAYHVRSGDEAVPVFSKAWRLLEPRGAAVLSWLSESDDMEGGRLPHPAAILHNVGRGKVACVPFDVFRDFAANRYPPTRKFIGEVIAAMKIAWDVETTAPACVDIIARRKESLRAIHIINRNSGTPHQRDNGAVCDIVPVGPIHLAIAGSRCPSSVEMVFEPACLDWRWENGVVIAEVDRVRLHAAILVRD